jgi:hypothetical protein
MAMNPLEQAPPQMGVGAGNFPATPAAPAMAPMATPPAPTAATPPAPTGGENPSIKQMQSLGDELFKMYGTDTQSMQADPRFAQLRQLQQDFGKDSGQINQQTWDQEAAQPAQAPM